MGMRFAQKLNENQNTKLKQNQGSSFLVKGAAAGNCHATDSLEWRGFEILILRRTDCKSARTGCGQIWGDPPEREITPEGEWGTNQGLFAQNIAKVSLKSSITAWYLGFARSTIIPT